MWTLCPQQTWTSTTHISTSTQISHTINQDAEHSVREGRAVREGQEVRGGREGQGEEDKETAHHAKPLRASFGAAPIDGARIGSAAADPGHVGIYLHVVLH